MRTVYLTATSLKGKHRGQYRPDDLSTWGCKQCEAHHQTGDAIYLRIVGYRPGLPYVKHQKRVTNSLNVVARVHVGDSASAPRQTCPALLHAPAMAVAIKSGNAKTQLPPKCHRTLTFISFFRMSSIFKFQNVLSYRNVCAIML